MRLQLNQTLSIDDEREPLQDYLKHFGGRNDLFFIKNSYYNKCLSLSKRGDFFWNVNFYTLVLLKIDQATLQFFTTEFSIGKKDRMTLTGLHFFIRTS